MIKPIRNKIINDALDNPRVSRVLKISGILATSVFGLYLIGHIFKIGAHTVNGFNELKTAVSNGK